MLLFSILVIVVLASKVEFTSSYVKFESNIYIWNLTSRQLELTLNSSNGHVTSLQVLPNNMLASGYDNGLVRLWNLTSHQVNFTFFHLNAGNLIRLCSLKRNNSQLLAVGTSLSVTMHNILTGQKEFLFEENNFFPVYMIDLYYGLFAISYVSHMNLFQLIVYDSAKNGNVKYVLSNSSNQIGPCVRVDKFYLACGVLGEDQWSNRVNVWSLISGQLEFSVKNSSVYLSDLKEKENCYLVTQSAIDFKIYVWDLVTKQLEFSLEGHRNLIFFYEKLLNDETRMFATKSLDNTTIVWNKNKTLAFKFENEWSANSVDLVYLPGKSICSLENDFLGDASGKDSVIKIWNLKSGNLEFALNQSNKDELYVFEMAKLENNLMASLNVNYV